MYILCLIGKEDRANVQKRVHYCDRKKKNLRLDFGVNDHLVHPFRSQISVLFGNCFRKSFAGHRTGLCTMLRFNDILSSDIYLYFFFEFGQLHSKCQKGSKIFLIRERPLMMSDFKVGRGVQLSIILHCKHIFTNIISIV